MLFGTSLIPNRGSQTQKIPPKISVRDNKVKSAAGKYLDFDEYKISDIEIINQVGNHHEYRGRPLPAYVISYEGSDKLKSYISIKDGQFQTVRHRSWRWFDFLWMTHTMDYEGRDDFNNKLIRAFSILGLITVMSGFLLWLVTSKTIRKIIK